MQNEQVNEPMMEQGEVVRKRQHTTYLVHDGPIRPPLLTYPTDRDRDRVLSSIISESGAPKEREGAAAPLTTRDWYRCRRPT